MSFESASVAVPPIIASSDIAVWEEAWFENWLRLPSEDAHIALMHVRP